MAERSYDEPQKNFCGGVKDKRFQLTILPFNAATLMMHAAEHGARYVTARCLPDQHEFLLKGEKKEMFEDLLRKT